MCTTADSHRRYFALRESFEKSTNIWESGERTISTKISLSLSYKLLSIA